MKVNRSNSLRYRRTDHLNEGTVDLHTLLKPNMEPETDRFPLEESSLFFFFQVPC